MPAGFIGKTFEKFIAPAGERDGSDVAVSNGYPLDSGEKGTSGRLSEVTLGSITGAPGMDAQASPKMGGFIGPGTDGLTLNKIGSKG